MLNIKILGPGCTNCTNLEKLCREVVAENGIDAEIEKTTDFKDIMSTPNLVLNGKVVNSGKLPTKSTLIHRFMNALANQEAK